LTHSVQALDLSMTLGPEAATDTTEAVKRIQQVKADFGNRLVILAHHYQRDAIVDLADFRGDSLQLSRQATQTEAEAIIFCGVHFMAEVAAILAKPGQHVLIPDETAGCYLADTATPAGVAKAWHALDTALGDAGQEVTPITYVNSSAALKAFCGRHNGIVCTSGNAHRVIRWALTQRPRIFFFPDQHLGRNTAHQMGIADEEMVVWQPHNPLCPEALSAAKVILWPGACNVHQRFREEHVTQVRELYPGIQVIVHPECRADVVRLADQSGSTAYIIKQIDASPAGTRWAVGTEAHLVARLQKEHPEQTIISLSEVPADCRTMSQITLDKLAQTATALAEGKLQGVVTVDEETTRWARVALERMLAL
ncbi:MAG: quinolinate synthase NadA, partial [Anaerolineae bacterium]|nr:quinolinate synthase NadA [Anaerolineae bacterium]